MQKRTNRILNIIIATVWLVNGLYCKILNMVPRHQEIVGEILGHTYSRELTIIIGVSEVCMAIWIISQYKSRINAALQMLIIATMNVIEFITVPDLLLWGQFNAIFAIIFIALIGFNEFVLKKTTS